jgi:hypothetical protein
MEKVKVVATKEGNVINVSQSDPEYGFIRVEQVCPQFTESGWLRRVKRSTLIKGKVEDLISMNYKNHQELPGKIIVKESFEPFNVQNPDQHLKIAGDTGIVCRVNDQPIYRETFYTPNDNAQDELIMHNNNEEIKEVMSAQRAIASLKMTRKPGVEL